jgi:GntR family transcriptional regulator
MSQTFYINSADPTPLYAQLNRAVQFAITIGKLAIGDQLPTVRQMAVDLRINANTVAKAYAELERTGVVETRRGVGTFVCARHFEARQRRRQDTELRDLVERVIEEAGGLGFSLDDLIDQLQSRRKKESKNNV